MEPYVRHFVDPLEGLEHQLKDLAGFSRWVPPLIEEARHRKWEEIASRPSDGETELVDVYEREVDEEGGSGFADYERTIYAATLVLGWEVFRDFLVQEVLERFAGLIGANNPIAQQLIREERTVLTRRFDRLRKRFREWLNVELTRNAIEGWAVVQQVQLARNAIVHNVGLYTREYLEGPDARLPGEGEVFGLAPKANMDKAELAERLVNRELIPLSADYVAEALTTMAAVARAVRERIESEP